MSPPIPLYRLTEVTPGARGGRRWATGVMTLDFELYAGDGEPVGDPCDRDWEGSLARGEWFSVDVCAS